MCYHNPNLNRPLVMYEVSRKIQSPIGIGFVCNTSAQFPRDFNVGDGSLLGEVAKIKMKSAFHT